MRTFFIDKTNPSPLTIAKKWVTTTTHSTIAVRQTLKTLSINESTTQEQSNHYDPDILPNFLLTSHHISRIFLVRLACRDMQREKQHLF